MTRLESMPPEELIALVVSLQKTIDELRATVDLQHTLIEELQNGTGSERQRRRQIKALNPNFTSEGLGERVKLILDMAETEAENLREEARREAARIRGEAADG